MTEQEKNVMQQALESLKNLASDLGKLEDEVPSIAGLQSILDQHSDEHFCAKPAAPPPRFPTMLRKMWCGGEVQAWIDENWNGRKI